MISAEEWDTRRWVIKNDLLNQGYVDNEASEIAEFEATEQFGDRPQDTKEQTR